MKNFYLACLFGAATVLMMISCQNSQPNYQEERQTNKKSSAESDDSNSNQRSNSRDNKRWSDENSSQPYQRPATTPTPTATPTPTPAPTQTPAPSNIVEFRIAAGTGSSDWNTSANTIEVKVGQTLRIINDDSISHLLHTNGRPCQHGSAFGPGQTFNCQIQATFEPGNNPLYDHNSNGKFWFRATN